MRRQLAIAVLPMALLASSCGINETGRADSDAPGLTLPDGSPSDAGLEFETPDSIPMPEMTVLTTPITADIARCILLNEGVIGCEQEVLHLETDLNKLNCNASDPGKENGVFDTRTAQAVSLFQKSNNIKVDALAGPQTRNLLASSEERLPCETPPITTTTVGESNASVPVTTISDETGQEVVDESAGTTTPSDAPVPTDAIVETNPCLTNLYQGVQNCEQEVKDSQNDLLNLQCLTDEQDIAVEPNGNFGYQTRWAVRKIQLENGIETTGTINTETRAILDNPDSNPCRAGDIDGYDRLACPIGELCVLTHVDQTTGLNLTELIDETGAVVDQFTVNVGKSGRRTPNTLSAQYRRESFKTPDSISDVGTIDYGGGISAKYWYGTRQVFSSEGGAASGLMFKPITWGNNGEADHGRVSYNGEDTNGGSLPLFDGDGRPIENNDYNGGGESAGCVHTPNDKLLQYDDTFYQEGVARRVLDQPSS